MPDKDNAKNNVEVNPLRKAFANMDYLINAQAPDMLDDWKLIKSEYISVANALSDIKNTAMVAVRQWESV